MRTPALNHNQTCENTLRETSNLLLGSGSLGFLILLSLLTSTLVSGLAPGVAELSVGTTLNWGWGIALLDLGNGGGVDDWQSAVGALDKVGLGGLDVGGGGITLLGLASLAWEKDELLLVSLKAGNVQGEGLGGEVLAAGINGDTDGRGELLWDTGLLQRLSENLPFLAGLLFGVVVYLQLLEGETTSSTNAAVVLDGWATDDWSQLVNWARGDSCGLGETSIAASELATWLLCELEPNSNPSSSLPIPILVARVCMYLVEVNANPALPILAEIYPSVSTSVLPRSQYISVPSYGCAGSAGCA